jgi:hypothetical protein
MEEFGTHVDRMMGNFTRFTSWERRVLERNIMFYGFLRFSLRYALWTMPTRHPIISSIAGHLSQLHEQEVRKLLGVSPDEPMLPGLLAKYIYMKDGQLMEMPFARMNPALNQITQASGMHQWLGALPPLIQEFVSQAVKKDVYFDQPFTLNGDPTYVHEPQKLAADLNWGERLQIAANNQLGLIAPVRAYLEAKYGRGPFSSDSGLIGGMHPLRYSDPDTAADIEYQQREYERRPTLSPFNNDVLFSNLIFPTPRPADPTKGQQERYLIRRGDRPEPSAVEKKLDRLDKFEQPGYFDLWLDKKFEQRMKELDRKLKELGSG